MLSVDFTKDALDALQALPPKHARQIATKINQLAADLNSVPIKELRGSSGYFRAKSGEYRIVFSVAENMLQIWLIGKRNDDEIYKRFMWKV